MPISWVLSLFKGAEDTGPVGILYENIVTQARSRAFYSELDVTDDLDGRFDMIAIHLFLSMDRLRQDPTLKKLSQKLANLVIADMDRSLREMGVGDMRVGKRVQDMGKALYGRLEMYDVALMDSEKSGIMLEEALMRNLYRSESAPHENAKKVAEYVLKQKEHLKTCSSEHLSDGQIEFKKMEDLINV